MKKTTLHFTLRNGCLSSVCKENGILVFISLTLQAKLWKIQNISHFHTFKITLLWHLKWN